MSAKTIEAARIAGAIKCMDALSKLDLAAQEGNMDQTVSEFYAQRLSDAHAFVAALGPMTPEQEGVIAVLAEYIHAGINDNEPGLAPGDWKPLSAMTDEERRAMIDREEVESADIDAAMTHRKHNWVSEIAELYDTDGNYHPIPALRADGNVLYLFPRAEGRAAP